MKKIIKGTKVGLLQEGSIMNKEVYTFLLALKSGDQVIVDKEDWAGVTPFTHTIHSSPRLKGKFTCKTLEDRSGWLVERI